MKKILSIGHGHAIRYDNREVYIAIDVRVFCQKCKNEIEVVEMDVNYNSIKETLKIAEQKSGKCKCGYEKVKAKFDKRIIIYPYGNHDDLPF